MNEKRKRRDVQPGEFHDPLKNYAEPELEDELERSLLHDTIALSMQFTPFQTVPPDTTVEAAMKLMADRDIACLMVTRGQHLEGVFSERDVLMKVALDFPKMRSKPVSEVMTRDPVAVHETDAAAEALNLMATGGFRHIPVLNVDDHVVGILGPRRVVAYLEKHFH